MTDQIRVNSCALQGAWVQALKVRFLGLIRVDSQRLGWATPVAIPLTANGHKLTRIDHALIRVYSRFADIRLELREGLSNRLAPS